MSQKEKEMFMKVYYLLDCGRVNDAKILLQKLLEIDTIDNEPEAA